VKQTFGGPDSEKWAEAIKSKVDNIEHHDTYTRKELPKGKRTPRCGLILRIKPAEDELPKRFKARLVAYGNPHTEGEDFVLKNSLPLS
jgi:hypothetical protein